VDWEMETEKGSADQKCCCVFPGLFYFSQTFDKINDVFYLSATIRDVDSRQLVTKLWGDE
jgi:hypothetical protein